MVVNDLLDQDVGDAGAVDASVVKSRNGFGGAEDQSVRAPKVDGELARPVPGQLVAVPWHAVHPGEMLCGVEGGQSTLQELPVVLAEAPASGLVAGAGLLQLAVLPCDVDDAYSLTPITLRVIA